MTLGPPPPTALVGPADTAPNVPAAEAVEAVEAAGGGAAVGRSWAHEVVPWIAAYVVLAVMARLTVLPAYGVALLFPAAGVAAAWLMVVPARRALVVPLAVFAVMVPVGWSALPLPSALLFAAAHALQLVALGALLRHVPRLGRAPRAPYAIDSPSSFLRFLTAVVVAVVVSAPLALLAVAVEPGEWQPLVAFTWLVRNASSIVVVAIPVLVLRQLPRDWRERDPGAWPGFASSARAAVELAVLVAYTTASVVVVLLTDVGAGSAFLLVVAIGWGAYRFGPPVAAALCVVLSLLTLVAAIQGTGLFTQLPDPLLQALFVQGFCGLGAVLAMLLALGTAEQHRLTGALRESAQQAQERLQLFEALAASTTDAVAVVDDRDQVVWSNRAAARLLPTSGDLSRWHLSDLDEVDLPHENLPHRRALAGSAVVHERVVRPAGERRERVVLSVSAASLDGFEDHARPTAALLMRDVTADDQNRQQLQSFAGVVAHDLRGPLTSITGWTESALDALTTDGDVEFAQQAMQRAVVRTSHMRTLLDDLLRHARAHQGPLEPVDLDVETLLLELGETHGIAVELRGPLPHLHGDRALLGQVLDNLVSNAAKYVAPGVDPRLEVTGEQQGQWRTIRLHDNGIGIPTEELSRIWAPFHRAHADQLGPDGAVYQGTGLGLAICRTIVERHGGRLEARPRDGAPGTTFELSLPDVATAPAP